MNVHFARRRWTYTSHGRWSHCCEGSSGSRARSLPMGSDGATSIGALEATSKKAIGEFFHVVVLRPWFPHFRLRSKTM